ncbi:MAG TPA: DUF58 domain-containing protein, partial [Planctomycetota bacterium]|nr:DUF58 domain-containing protein [Planctomycetota bacterium]
MRPGPRCVRTLLALAAASLLAGLIPVLVWPVLAAVGVLAMAMVVERRLLSRVTVTHEEAPIWAVSLDEEERIDFRLATDAPRAVRLVVRRSWPALLAEPSTTLAGSCPPGETLTLSCPVRGVVRGRAALDGPHLALSFWGWAERLVSLPGRSELKVLPNLKAVKRMHRMLNDAFLRGLGQRTAPRLGKGREFDRLREYTVDDDFRDIAWKASARHRKLIVREFRLDRSQDVLVCIDRGHRMAAQTTRIRRVDHAVNAAVLISYICSRMEDRVGVLSFGAQVDGGIPQGRGAAHLSRITAYSSSIQAEYIHTDYLALGAHVRRRLQRRALILILTTLPESGDQQALVRATGMLLPTHLPLIVVLSDPALRAAAEALPASREELSRTLVARDLWIERRKMMDELRRR